MCSLWLGLGGASSHRRGRLPEAAQLHWGPDCLSAPVSAERSGQPKLPLPRDAWEPPAQVHAHPSTSPRLLPVPPGSSGGFKGQARCPCVGWHRLSRDWGSRPRTHSSLLPAVGILPTARTPKRREAGMGSEPPRLPEHETLTAQLWLREGWGESAARKLNP